MTLTILNSKEITNDQILSIIPIDKEGLSVYLKDPFTTKIGIVTDDKDEIIAVGFLRIVNEAKIIVNDKKCHFEIAKAIKELFNKTIDEVSEHGSNEIISIITQGGEHYIKILEKLGFNKIAGVTLKIGV